MRISSIGSNYPNKNRFGSIKYNIKPGVDDDDVAGVKADIIIHSMLAAEGKTSEAIRLCLAAAFITKPQNPDNYPIDVTIAPQGVTIKMPQTVLLNDYNATDYYVSFHKKNKYIVKYIPGDTPDNLFFALKKANKRYFDTVSNAYTVKWFIEKYNF